MWDLFTERAAQSLVIAVRHQNTVEMDANNQVQNVGKMTNHDQFFNNIPIAEKIKNGGHID